MDNEAEEDAWVEADEDYKSEDFDEPPEEEKSQERNTNRISSESPERWPEDKSETVELKLRPSRKPTKQRKLQISTASKNINQETEGRRSLDLRKPKVFTLSKDTGVKNFQTKRGLQGRRNIVTRSGLVV